MESSDDLRPLSDEEIEQIMATEFTHATEDGVRVYAALHPGFNGIPPDLTLSICFGETCCNGLVLPPDAARELAWTLLRAAEIIEKRG